MLANFIQSTVVSRVVFYLYLRINIFEKVMLHAKFKHLK